MEKLKNGRQKFLLRFVDLKKASYDKVNRSKRWNVIAEYGVDAWVVDSVKAIYQGNRSFVKVNEILGDKCVTEAYTDGERIMVRGMVVSILLYPDDAINGEERGELAKDGK